MKKIMFQTSEETRKTCAFNPNSDIKIMYLLVKTNFRMNFKRQTHILLNSKNYQGLISVPSNFLIQVRLKYKIVVSTHVDHKFTKF